MRFNSMTRDNDRKTDYLKYIFYAVAFAVASFFVLNVAFGVLVIALNLALAYWWAVIILVLLMLFVKKRGRKSES